MERLRELRALLKGWESAFERENGRRPGKSDLAAASEETQRLYRAYRELKQQPDPAEPSPTAEKEPALDSGCWGAHLNRQPKVPGTRQPRPPSASAQLYGMRLKANLGAALQATSSAVVRKSLTARRKAAAEAASPSALCDEVTDVLPTTVRGLAPLITASGPRPRPQTERFQRLKETVARRLGSLDPGWLQRCQQTTGCEEGGVGFGVGTRGRDEGTGAGVRMAGAEMGTPGPQMGTRAGVRTPGGEMGTPGCDMGTPGHEEWTGAGVRTPGPEMGTPEPEMGTRAGVRTPGQDEGTPGPEMGTLGCEMGTGAGVRMLGPELGTLGCEEGTRTGVRTREHGMGTAGCEEGVPRPEEGTPGPEVGTPRPRRRTARLKEVTVGCEERMLEPAVGPPGPEMGTLGQKEVRTRRKRGTPGPEMGAPGPEVGTTGHEERTPGPEMGTLGRKVVRTRRKRGTPGPEMGTAEHEVGTTKSEEGTPEPEVGTMGRKVVRTRRKRGTPGPEMGTTEHEMGTTRCEEGTPGPEMGTLGREERTPGPEVGTSRSRGRKRGTAGHDEGTAAPKGDTGRCGIARDGAVDVTKPRAARRKRPCPEDSDGAHTAAPKRRKAALSPSENLLGDLEVEEKKPRAASKAHPARAPRRPHGNFVRLNLKSRSHVRHGALRGRQLRKQVWKEKWQKKAAWLRGGDGADRSSDVCFKCGARGHWAAQCRGRDTSAHPPPPSEPFHPNDEEEEEGDPLPTLEEVARRTNTVYHKLPALSTDQDGATLSGLTPFLDVQRPPYEPPSPPPPVEPLYSLGPDGKPPETPTEVLDALSELGYSSFRLGQEVAIMRILSGLSTLVVLPTGMGKSLCYQLPAFLYHKRSRSIALVISPLVSLMNDQVSGLPSCLHAVCVHSQLSRAQRDAALRRVRDGSAQVLLLSPEAVVGAGSSGCCCLPPAHQLPPVAFVCIDEAHCVSEWSHNFRPSYLRLCKVLRERLGVRCFLALTATATLATVRDVAAHLGIPKDDGIAVQCSAVPENLRLSVSVERDRDRALVSLLCSKRFTPLRSVIVYCTRREDTSRVAAMLRTCLQDMLLDDAAPGAKSRRRLPAEQIADAYHAGLSGAERRRVQSAFMSGRLRVVVATVAFGMGLDKADVRAVVHYHMPRSFESYVQEIGRAGRDGEPAQCHLFLDPEGSDRYELRRHIFADAVDPLTIKKLVRAAFPPCQCRELQRRRRILAAGGEVSDSEMAELNMEDSRDAEVGNGVSAEEGNQDGVASDRDGDDAKEGGGRVCYKHERAIPIESIVHDLDLREEAIETLLCYLELHPRRWLELLPHTYAVCTVSCAGGHAQLRAAARSCPPLAAALSLSPPPPSSSSIRFDLIALSDALGWEAPLVRRALLGAGRDGVAVEFSEPAFRVRSYGDLSGAESDAACLFLLRRARRHRAAELRRLRRCLSAFQSVAFQGRTSYPEREEEEEEEEERSRRLKALLREYFDEEEPGEEEEKEEEDDDDDEGLSAADAAHLRSSIRHFLSVHHDARFSPRAVARIFHGIGSPRYPANIYGRDRRFWRQHLRVGFRSIARAAALEIVALR